MSNRRFESLTPEALEKIAERNDTIVMKEEYDHFEAWEVSKVRACVMKLRNIAVRAESEREAREQALKDPVLAEFSKHYRTIFKRMTQPEVARKEENVQTILHFMELKERMDRGELTEMQAKSLASDFAISSLLAQAGAPKPPPQAIIEELD